MDVTDLESRRPHIHLNAGKRSHVFPRALIVNIIEGRVEIEKVEEWKIMVKDILADWLRLLDEDES